MIYETDDRYTYPDAKNNNIASWEEKIERSCSHVSGGHNIKDENVEELRQYFEKFLNGAL
jgi:hypothetical protein